MIARLARRAEATLPCSCGWWNYKDKKDFVAEIRRMRLWYREGRRLTRRRRGLLRVRAGTNLQVRGRKTIWSAKLEKHYKLLKQKLRLQGLMRWRRCALALHKAGIGVQSGTLPVERLWSHFSSFFPSQQRSITEPMFKLLSGLGYLRYNWGHYNRPAQPTWTRGDALLAQRSAEMLNMLRAASDGEVTPMEAELVVAFNEASRALL